MKCIIIDDEPLARTVISRHIEQLPNLELVGSFESAMEGFNCLQSQKIDLVFLDIQMPKMNGLSFLKSLRNRPFVILCTAYREYALDGFDLDVVDYLLKPISFDRFLQAIDKIFTRSQKEIIQQEKPVSISSIESKPFIFVKSEKEHVKILLEDIFYVESLKNHVRIKTQGADIITLKQIGHMEEKLPPQHFMRIHRSFIISLKKVDRFTQSHVTIGDKLIPIGRLYKQGVLHRLQKHLI
ncbi:MAG: LytTR family DNA-binding domain-containing protein [Bacteroidota bacterium]